MRLLKIIIALFFGLIASAANAQAVSATEAEAAARKYWNLVLTRCSDSYYYGWDRVLDGTETTQYKRISFPARMAIMIIEPSEADRLNGLTWRGDIVLNVGLNRKFSTINGKHEWSDWSDGHQIKLGMWKDKGHWLVNPNEWGDGRSIDIELLHKSSCMDIPGTQEYDKQHLSGTPHLPAKVYYSGRTSEAEDQQHAREVMRKAQDESDALHNEMLANQEKNRRKYEAKLRMEDARREGVDSLIGETPFCAGPIPRIDLADRRVENKTFLKVLFDARGHASSITVLNQGANKSDDDYVIQAARQWIFQVYDGGSKAGVCIEEVEL